MSQANAFLATTGVYGGLTAANAINAALDALLTGNSGSVAPTNALGGVPKLGQTWLDTTSATLPVLKMHTGSAWVTLAVIDVSNGIWVPVVGGGIGTIASATTPDIGGQPQSVLNVTGTVTITGLGSTAVVGQRKILIFGGILTFTHNATTLIIPGGLNKTTAAGDVAEVVYLGSGHWRVVSYVPLVGTNVTSIAGLTGDFTLARGLTNSTNILLFDTQVLAGLLGGLELSTAGSSATFSVAVGSCVDSTNLDFLKLTSAISKTTASWAVGSSNGGLDTGAIANNTWYHVYLIKRPDTGVVDVLVSTSVSAPTMPTNYTFKRRIGSMKTNGSAQWTKFAQIGDIFLWDVPVQDQSAIVLGASTLYTLASVPLGITVQAYISSILTSTAAAAAATLSSPLITAPVVGTPTANQDLQTQAANQVAVFVGYILTDTSQRIRAVSNGAGTISWSVAVRGWIDTRGK